LGEKDNLGEYTAATAATSAGKTAMATRGPRRKKGAKLRDVRGESQVKQLREPRAQGRATKSLESSEATPYHFVFPFSSVHSSRQKNVCCPIRVSLAVGKEFASRFQLTI